MKIQTREYIEFIKSFTEQSNIMNKSFFIVVPYSPAALGGSSNPVMNMLSRNKKATPTNDEAFEEHRSQLEQRVSVVEQGLTRCGVKVIQLGTEEMVELFYKIFNPGETEKPIKV